MHWLNSCYYLFRSNESQLSKSKFLIVFDKNHINFNDNIFTEIHTIDFIKFIFIQHLLILFEYCCF